MKFGTLVRVRRGSPGRSGRPGCLRYVRGILVGACCRHRRVRLLHDDPLALYGYCTKAGDIGEWGSSVCEREGGHMLRAYYTRSLTEEAPRGRVHFATDNGDHTICGKVIDGPMWYLSATFPVNCPDCLRMVQSGEPKDE